MRFTHRTLTVAIGVILLTGCQDSSRSDPQPDLGEDRSGAAMRVTDAGPQVTQNFRLADFTSISLTGGDDVKVRQGTRFQISARGAERDLEQLVLRLESGKLLIGRKSGAAIKGDKIKIDIVMPALSGISVTGSGDLDAEMVSGDDIAISVTGSGDAKVDRLTASRASLHVSGSGDLEVKGGRIEKGDYRLTGSGDLDADALSAANLVIEAKGSGDVEAMASGGAEVRSSGSGDVKVKGGATCSVTQSGSGQIRCG